MTDWNEKAVSDFGIPLAIFATMTPGHQYHLLKRVLELDDAHEILGGPLVHAHEYDRLGQMIDYIDGDDIDAIVIEAVEQDDVETIRHMIESGASPMYPDLFITAARSGAKNAYRYFSTHYPQMLEDRYLMCALINKAIESPSAADVIFN